MSAPAVLRRSIFVAATLACGAWALVLGCAGTSAGRSTVSAERSVRPGVNDKYFAPGAADEWTGIFEGESREVVKQRDRILEALELQAGMVVGDIGAGTGLFSLELARRVGPGGEVYASDIVPEFLARIRERARQAGLSNLKTVLGKDKTTGISEGSLDLAFLCNVYHHLEYPVTYMRAVARTLKPGARLVVIDFERIEGETSPPMLKHVRAGKRLVLEELKRAGFELLQERPLLRENYFLVLRAVNRPG